MIAALEAAERAGGEGLHWTVAGWHWEPDGVFAFHGGIVVSRLVWDRKFLEERGPGRGPKARRVITDNGRAWLAAYRAEKAGRA